MQVQNLNSTSGICLANFSAEVCKVVASYYLMTIVLENDSNLIDLERRANETFEHWVSQLSILGTCNNIMNNIFMSNLASSYYVHGHYH